MSDVYCLGSCEPKHSGCRRCNQCEPEQFKRCLQITIATKSPLNLIKEFVQDKLNDSSDDSSMFALQGILNYIYTLEQSS